MTEALNFKTNRVPKPFETGDRVVPLNRYTLIQTNERSRQNLETLTLELSSRFGRIMRTYGDIYDVYDREPTDLNGIPISQTNLPIDFHTDSSQKDTIPDVVGLTCVQHAYGGETILTDVRDAYVRLEKFHPWTLQILHQSFPRAIVTPGSPRSVQEIKRNSFPIFQFGDTGNLEMRYMRSWVEEGSRLLGNPLDELHITALDHLDSALESSIVYQRQLKPGDILFFNNRQFAHARLPYQDFVDKKRHLLRVWLGA